MIKTENLSFSYTGARPYILDGINLYIRDGEYVSVVGENGSGKSTLIRLILKFLKPTLGSIVTESARIGYVPQRSDYSNAGFPITVYEMLNSYRKLLKIKNRESIGETLDRFGLSNHSRALMGTLSGGQGQKALIARAMLGNPDLLILDEPSTGVDADSQKEIYALIKKLNVEDGKTIISVEHNLGAAIANSTLIYHLANANGHFCTPQHFAAEYLDVKEEEISHAQL
jgi:zinc transport system ATP-binding protein